MRIFRLGNRTPGSSFIIIKSNHSVVLATNPCSKLHPKSPKYSLSISSIYRSGSSCLQSARSGGHTGVTQKLRADIPIYFEYISILQGYHRVRGWGKMETNFFKKAPVIKRKKPGVEGSVFPRIPNLQKYLYAISTCIPNSIIQLSWYHPCTLYRVGIM